MRRPFGFVRQIVRRGVDRFDQRGVAARLQFAHFRDELVGLARAKRQQWIDRHATAAALADDDSAFLDDRA